MSKERVYKQCVDILRSLEKPKAATADASVSDQSTAAPAAEGSSSLSELKTRSFSVAEFEEILQKRYDSYCAKHAAKSKKTEDSTESPPLTLHDFVVCTAIYKQKDFVFKNLMLSFQLMLDFDKGHSVVYAKDFLKWAPRMSPMASKRSVKRLFYALSRASKTADASAVEASAQKPTASGLPTSSPRYSFREAFKARITQSTKIGETSDCTSALKLDISDCDFAKDLSRCLHFDQFCAYVKNLQKQVTLERSGGDAADVRSTVGDSVFPARERVIDYQRGAVDIGGMPPRPGFVVVTEKRVIFHGRVLVSKITNSCLFSEIKSLTKTKAGGGFLRRDTSLIVETTDGREWHWNFVGAMSTSKAARDRVFETLNTLTTVYRVLRTREADEERVPIADDSRVRTAVVREAVEDVMRDNAIYYAVGAEAAAADDSALATVSIFRYATDDCQREYIDAVENSLAKFDAKLEAAEKLKREEAKKLAERTSKSWMSLSSWTGTSAVAKDTSASADATGGSEATAGSSPKKATETSMATAAAMSSGGLLGGSMATDGGFSNDAFIEECLLADENEEGVSFVDLSKEALEREEWARKEREKEALLLAEASKGKRPSATYEEFDHKVFIKHVQVIKIHFEPAQYLVKLAKAILWWKNEQVSAGCWLVLATMCLTDSLRYLPSLFLGANALVLAGFRSDKDWTVEMFDKLLFYCSHAPEYSQPYAADWASKPRVALPPMDEAESGGGIWARVKQVKDKFDKARFELGEIQGALSKVTVDLGRIRALYLWKAPKQSHMFWVFSVTAAVTMTFLPIWFVAFGIICGLFWKKCPLNPNRFKKKDKNPIDKLIDAIEPDIPDVDDNEAEEKAKDESPPALATASSSRGRRSK